jgi:hypothetical protein
MGCQMESHGAALKAYQAAYGPQGLFVCGLARQEHPYDIEDYVRHFQVRFPVYVDLNGGSSRDCFAGLDGVAVLDADHKRIRTSRGGPADPLEARAVLAQLFAKSGSGPATHRPHNVLNSGAAGTPLSPRITQPGWSQPVLLGPGKYPRIVTCDTNQALCVWVAGDVPAQRLFFSVYNGRQWQEPQAVPAGEDAHAAALDAGSQPVMAWSQKEGQTYRIFFSRLAGSQWSKPLAISPAGADAFRPDVYCPPGGEPVIAWYAWKIVQLSSAPDSWWRSIYVTTLARGAPGPSHELAKLERGSDDCWDPVITGAPGALQVTWLRDENPPRLFSSAQGPSGWSAQAGLLPTSRSRDVFCGVRAASPIRNTGRRDGLVFEAGLEKGDLPPLRRGLHVYAQQRTADGWSQPMPLSSGPGCHLAPVAVQLSTGERLVFWWDLVGEQASIRLCTLRGAKGDSASSEPLVAGDCRNLYPAACPDASGQVWLAWQSEQGQAGSAVFAARRLATR